MIEKVWSNRVVQHILFWFSFLIFITITSGGHHQAYLKEFIRLGGVLPFKIVATYITLYILFPRFLQKKNYFKFFLYFFLLLFVFASIQLVLNKCCVYPSMGYVKNWTIPFHITMWLNVCFYTLAPMTLASTIKLVRMSFAEQKKLQELQLKNVQLKQEKSDAELKFLKGQINPHFLLNTLNGLYSLALQNSELTAEMISKLADLLKYTLYEANAPFVTVGQEINYIENYLSLEQSRYGERLDIVLQVKKVETEWQIAPLILLAFVENAIKHGVSKHTEDAWTHLEITMKEKELHFYIGNSKSENEQTDLAESSKGIGLTNVKRRLDLLYPDTHILNIINKPQRFEVWLTISPENKNELKD